MSRRFPLALALALLHFAAGFAPHYVQIPSYLRLASTVLDRTSSTSLPSHLFVNITHRTQACLDFDVVLRALRECTVTIAGARRVEDIASHLSATSDLSEVNAEYAKVEQLAPNLGYLPLRNRMDIWPVLTAIETNGSPPEQEDLLHFAEIIEELAALQIFLSVNQNKLDLFRDISARMLLPQELLQAFEGAFDEEGELSVKKYPSIRKFRSEASALKGRIINTIKGLLNSQEMKEKLADTGFIEIEGRFCLMLKNTYKKGVGIVHGSSNTGRSLYVEPMEAVEPTNEMKSVLASLKAEEGKILFEMCQTISRFRREIRSAIDAVTDLDLVRAKAKLGEAMRGCIPQVGDEGVIRCVAAQHPVLLLRGAVGTVGNNIEINDDSCRALVISGPNAGGKTVVLKTAGLFALMVKLSIPLPAKAGARVDLFQVMADIGDMQTVSGDLSTFSGHLCVCREMLLAAQAHAGPSLVLLDEIGTGTDPAQGAALAQAVLEELLRLGTRVIVTTHYQRIKELAAEDSRFQIAAMEFIDSRPTYRLRLGSVGESYALEAGRRMMLPERVLERANGLLDDESRRLIALQKRLEEETELARQRQTELIAMQEQLVGKERQLAADRVVLAEAIEQVKGGRNDAFLDELKARERELSVMVKRAEESMAADMSRQSKEKIISEIQGEVRTMRIEVERGIVEQVAEELATPLPPGEPIEEGTTLVVLEKGSIFGSRGIVTQRNKGRGRVVIRVAGVEVKMERHLLGLPLRQGKLGFLVNSKSGLEAEGAASGLSSREKKLLRMLQDDVTGPAPSTPSSRQRQQVIGMRTQANTLDLRSCGSYEEAAAAIESFIERQMDLDGATRSSCVYINHGTNGSIKPKLREKMKKHPMVLSAGAAAPSDGGDVYTVLALALDD